MAHHSMDAKISETPSAAAARERSRAAAAVFEAEQELLEARTQVEIKTKYCTEMLKRLMEANTAVEVASARAASALKEVDRVMAERAIAETYEQKARKGRQEALTRVVGAERLLANARRRLRLAEESVRLTGTAYQKSRSVEETTSLADKHSLSRSGTWHAGKNMLEDPSCKEDNSTEKGESITQSISLPVVSEVAKLVESEQGSKVIKLPAAVTSDLAKEVCRLSGLVLNTKGPAPLTRLSGSVAPSRQSQTRHQVSRISRDVNPSTTGKTANTGLGKTKYRKMVQTPSSSVVTRHSAPVLQMRDEKEVDSGERSEEVRKDSVKLVIDYLKLQDKEMCDSQAGNIPALEIYTHQSNSKADFRQSSVTSSLKETVGEGEEDSFKYDGDLVASISHTAPLFTTPLSSVISTDIKKSTPKNVLSAPSIPRSRTVSSVTELVKKASAFDLARSGSSLADNLNEPISKFPRESNQERKTDEEEPYSKMNTANGSLSNLMDSNQVEEQSPSLIQPPAKPVSARTSKLLASLRDELAVPLPVVKWTDFIPPDGPKSGDSKDRNADFKIIPSRTMRVLNTSVHHNPEKLQFYNETESPITRLVSLGVNSKDLPELQMDLEKSFLSETPQKEKSSLESDLTPLEKEENTTNINEKCPDFLVNTDASSVNIKPSAPALKPRSISHLQVTPLEKEVSSQSEIFLSDKPRETCAPPHFMKQVKFSEYLQFARLSPDMESYRSDFSEGFQNQNSSQEATSCLASADTASVDSPESDQAFATARPSKVAPSSTVRNMSLEPETTKVNSSPQSAVNPSPGKSLSGRVSPTIYSKTLEMESHHTCPETKSSPNISFSPKVGGDNLSKVSTSSTDREYCVKSTSSQTSYNKKIPQSLSIVENRSKSAGQCHLKVASLRTSDHRWNIFPKMSEDQYQKATPHFDEYHTYSSTQTDENYSKCSQQKFREETKIAYPEDEERCTSNRDDEEEGAAAVSAETAPKPKGVSSFSKSTKSQSKSLGKVVSYNKSTAYKNFLKGNLLHSRILLRKRLLSPKSRVSKRQSSETLQRFRDVSPTRKSNQHEHHERSSNPAKSVSSPEKLRGRSATRTGRRDSHSRLTDKHSTGKNNKPTR